MRRRDSQIHLFPVTNKKSLTGYRDRFIV